VFSRLPRELTKLYKPITDSQSLYSLAFSPHLTSFLPPIFIFFHFHFLPLLPHNPFSSFHSPWSITWGVGKRCKTVSSSADGSGAQPQLHLMNFQTKANSCRCFLHDAMDAWHVYIHYGFFGLEMRFFTLSMSPNRVTAPVSPQTYMGTNSTLSNPLDGFKRTVVRETGGGEEKVRSKEGIGRKGNGGDGMRKRSGMLCA